MDLQVGFKWNYDTGNVYLSEINGEIQWKTVKHTSSSEVLAQTTEL